MPPSSSNSQPPGRSGRSTPPAQVRKSQATAGSKEPIALTRRALSRRQRERENQRRVLIVAGSAIGVALLIVLAGILYDQVWLPSRTVAQVNGASLTRRQYWQERRYTLARQIAQNLQLVSLFGGQQVGGQFQNQSPGIDQQVKIIRTAPLDSETIKSWEDDQITLQGASTLTNTVNVSIDEANQRLVQDLGKVFLPPPLISSTTSITPTTLPAVTATVTPTIAPTNTPGGPTATAAPTLTAAPSETPAPTNTPEPTAVVSVANEQLPKIIDELYQRYETELQQAEQKPQLTSNDFLQALQNQYKLQVTRDRIEEQLVPESNFVVSTTPSKVTASQILLKVTVPVSGTQQEQDQAYNARLKEAQDLVAQARSGKDFAELAKQYSEDPGSKEKGGELGSFDKDGKTDSGAQYDPAVVTAAYGLQENTISDPVKSPFGWHIIKVTSRQVDSKEDQLRTARSAALDKWVQAQRAKDQVQRFLDVTETPAVPTAPPEPTTPPTYVPGPPTAVPTLAPTTAPITGTGTLSDTGTLTNTLPITP